MLSSHRPGQQPTTHVDTQLQDLWTGLDQDVERANRQASNLRSLKVKSVRINEHAEVEPVASSASRLTKPRRSAVDAASSSDVARQLAFAAAQEKHKQMLQGSSTPVQQRTPQREKLQAQEETGHGRDASRSGSTTVVAMPVVQNLDMDLLTPAEKPMTAAQRREANRTALAERQAQREAELERAAEN